MELNIFKNLKNPVSLMVALGVAVLFFDLNYYFISTLPGEVGNACVPGANFTPVNVGFAVLLSLLAGVMVSGVIDLYRLRRGQAGVGSALSAVGLLVGTFTVFCTACTIPFITLFGLSIGLGFFSVYNLSFKIVSLVLMLGGLHFLNQQLREGCKVCKK